MAWMSVTLRSIGYSKSEAVDAIAGEINKDEKTVRDAIKKANALFD